MVIACILDVLISLGEESAESLVRVDHSEFRSLPAELSSGSVQIPDSLGNKEVIILNLSVEVVRRNVEESFTSVEVEMDSIALGNSGLPAGVILVSVEGMHCIAPCILEALDSSKVLFLTHGNHQVLALDNAAISKHHLAIFRVKPVYSIVI